MEVCEVCGAFLIVGDAQSRVDDHLMGKQHMGYAKIKSTVEELKVIAPPFWRLWAFGGGATSYFCPVHAVKICCRSLFCL